MKRVICLYRVSTAGQVDHDDIPMQRLACREYVSFHEDWEIVDEISEMGVSGYKVSTNDRDAIMEIKKRASKRQFDVLLVSRLSPARGARIRDKPGCQLSE